MRDDLFDPVFFAHGRVLYRYPGSDACRFSPGKAYHMIDLVARVVRGESCVLWDPFCGTGLIPTVAAMFFSRAFTAIVASDVDVEAVQCAAKNLALTRRPEAAARRLRIIGGLRGRNRKSEMRWGAVQVYLDRLTPLIRQNAAEPVLVHTLTASAFALPHIANTRVAFVGDIPYGRGCRLTGHGTAGDVIAGMLSAYPNATIRLVVTSDQAALAPNTVLAKAVERIPFKGGRVLLRVA